MTENEGTKPVPEASKCPQCGTIQPAGALGGLCPACLLKQGVSGDTGGPPESNPFVPPPVTEIAALFPQLEIIRLIGKGGMGAVYLARQASLDRMVALKILPAQRDQGFAERFTREARALARLSHPNIVMVHEFGIAGTLHYFLMEYVDGVNLRQMQVSGRLSPREALQIVPQLCEALQYAHDQGVVHRDIKPDNVLIDRRGRVKIADFGLAKMLGQDAADLRLTGEGHVMGTPHYMSPEQIEHPLDVDHRADIYSLGVVFYEMLTGELPLGRFGPPSSKVQIDVRLDEVVLRALEKEPNRRYQHASQVKTAVDTITSSAPPPPIPNMESLAREILVRDYVLDVGSCVRRGWALVKADFFPLVGVTALIAVLLGIAGSFDSAITGSRSPLLESGGHLMSLSGILEMLVFGPLMGGLCLYYLKKIRREVTGVEVAFSGFNKRFLHLFLGGFVATALTMLGFLCLILPGIYFFVAWIFTLPLIMDKQLDFWPAMELSRKIVTRHWWKFLGFGLLLWLLTFAGLLVCAVGFFVTAPIALAALLYAYEDIFSGTTPAAKAAASHQSTSFVMPLGSWRARPGLGFWKPLFTGLGILLLAVIIIIASIGLMHTRKRNAAMRAEHDSAVEYWTPPIAEGEKIDPSQALEEAKKLTARGNYEEALQHYLWFFNHALEYDSSLSGVRLSSALSDWTELGRRYPKARQAMVSIRNRDLQEFELSRGYFDLFSDLAALNHYLQDDDSTEMVFHGFRNSDRDLASQCFPLVEDLLVKKHEYKLCMDYIQDPQAAFSDIARSRERLRQQEVGMADRQKALQQRLADTSENSNPDPSGIKAFPPIFPDLPLNADKNFVAKTRQLIEILVSRGRKTEAEKICDQALDILPDDRLKTAVSDAETRIGKGS